MKTLNVTISGEPGAGKTALARLLRDAVRQLESHPPIHVEDPDYPAGSPLWTARGPRPMIRQALADTSVSITTTSTARPRASTRPRIFDSLVALAQTSNGGRSGGTLLTADLIHQDALYDLQAKLADLLLEASESDADRAKLIRLFPHSFEETRR